MKYTPSQLAKGIVSAIATVVTIVTAALSIPGIVPLPWLPYIAGGVSILGTVAVIIKRNEPILDGKVSTALTVESLAANVMDVRTLIAQIFQQLNPPLPEPAPASPVSVVVNTPGAAATAPVAVPAAPTGTYPDGPYVPPKPAYTGPIPPVSEPVGATAVSATP